nr:glycosyltransferase [cf. Phormidesmis sp. LEGE 11477]
MLSPQLVHAHFGPDAVRAIPISKALNIPLVVTFHGYGLTVKPSYAWRESLSQLIYLLRKNNLRKKATHFIAVSNYIKKLLIEQAFPPQKISTHYTGIDTCTFTPDEHVRRTPTVLFVGRLVEVKGCNYLIRAMSKVQSIFPDAELVVLGDGPLRSQLESSAQQRLKKYRFLGFQSPEVVREWMNRSKVFCVPSITAKTGHTEAFGMVFIEAQAMGLPVVTFDIGGIPEAVAHNQTGFLVPGKDVDALSTRLISLLKDSERWQGMSQKGIRRVREKFDIRRQTKLLEDLYSVLIAQA